MYKTQYAAGNNDDGPSPIIWADCPTLEIIYDPGFGVHFYDNFQDFNGTVTSNVGTYGKYKSYEDTGGTIKKLDTQLSELEIATDGSDDDEMWLELGDGNGGLVKITKGDGKKVWFEARFKFDDITNSSGLFVGLAEAGLAAIDTIADATMDLASKDYIGFRVEDGTQAGLDAVHRKNGAAEQVVKDGAHTLVVDTYVKAGFKFDGSNLLTYYINGVSVGTVEIDDSTFTVDGEVLTPLVGFKNGTALLHKLTMSFWRVAQVTQPT